MQQIINWVKQDPLRVKALECVSTLNLPQGYIAAGFVRNLVWDHLHNKSELSLLNDVDVIYFDPDEDEEFTYKVYETELNRLMPGVNWQVRNQAKIHHRNGDMPYKSVLDAMSFWPEKETAVAIRQSEQGIFECLAAFGFTSLLNLQLTYNPKREKAVFEARVNTKYWLIKWPRLNIRDQ